MLWSLGTGEIILILLLILLFFGAKRIPDLARGLGKGIREFKDAKNGENEKKNAEKN
jgi:sec-independent protein translocase protein TatA